MPNQPFFAVLFFLHTIAPASMRSLNFGKIGCFDRLHVYIYIHEPAFFNYPVWVKYSALPSLGKLFTSKTLVCLVCSYKTGLARCLYIIFQFIEITKKFIHKKIHKKMTNVKLNFGDVVIVKNINNQQKMFFSDMADEANSNEPQTINELLNWSDMYTDWYKCYKLAQMLNNC